MVLEVFLNGCLILTILTLEYSLYVHSRTAWHVMCMVISFTNILFYPRRFLIMMIKNGRNSHSHVHNLLHV